MACLLLSTQPLPETMLIYWWLDSREDIVNCTLRNKLQWNLNRNSNIFIHDNALQNVVCQMASVLSRPQCVKYQKLAPQAEWWWIAGVKTTTATTITADVASGSNRKSWATLWTFFDLHKQSMMTSSNGNIFRVTGHLCGEFTGPQWIPRTKASDAELWCFLWSAPE